MEVQQQVPKWILIVTALFALMEIGVSIFLCVSPEASLEHVDLSAKGVDYLVYMWAARQFALGIILAYATIKRSAAMISLAYIFLLLMFLGDLAIGIWQQNNAMIISAVVMCLICGLLLYFIHKRK